jgi:hypothetical protein
MLAALAVPARAQPTASARVSADSVTVGERFTLTLEARHADSLRALFPDPARGDTLLGDLVVIARTDVTTESEGGSQRDRARYEVTTFALDTAYVPPLPVRLAGSRDTSLVLSSLASVPVQSLVPEGASGIRDLAPLASFPRPWWFWPTVLLAPLLLAALGYYLWHRRQQADEEPESEGPAPRPPVPPHESAKRRLRKLEQTTDWNAPDERKPFYVELADIARTYLKRRLDVAAPESTTGELMQLLDDQVGRGRMPGDARDQLRRVLEKADQVKFANRRPSAKISKKLLATTREVLGDVEERQRKRERQRERERQRRRDDEQQPAARANEPTT